jgi:hypothetical protein
MAWMKVREMQQIFNEILKSFYPNLAKFFGFYRIEQKEQHFTIHNEI